MSPARSHETSAGPDGRRHSMPSERHEGPEQRGERQQLERREGGPEEGRDLDSRGHDEGEDADERRGAQPLGERTAEPEVGGHGAREPRHHRGRAQEGAHVGHPAHHEGGQVAEGGAGEDDGPAVLVEAPAEHGEKEGHRHHGQSREQKDPDPGEPGSVGGHRGGSEEDAHPDDPVHPEREELEGADPARGVSRGHIRRLHHKAAARTKGGEPRSHCPKPGEAFQTARVDEEEA